MPRGGHNAKPTPIRAIEGNAGHRPMNDAEPEPSKKKHLKPPPGLDHYGKWAWKEFAPVLDDMGVLTDADRLQLGSYCRAYSRMRHAEKALKDFTPADREYRVVVTTIEKAEQQMRLLATEFGMNPMSRSRIKIEPQVPENPVETWMNERRSS